MKELGITYTKGSTYGEFYRYADVSFANNHDLTLMSGNVFILNGGTITWSLKKEITPALSTTEAEFNSMACAEKDIIWLWNLYKEISYKLKKAMILYGDNKSVIAIITNAQFHKWAKYFNLKNLHMRESIQVGWLTLIYCPTGGMTTDILTEALPHQLYMLHTKGLSFYSAWGEVLEYSDHPLA